MAFSFFFRDWQTLEHSVRLLCASRRSANRTFIWDAGCAEGQETYTLAILLAENMRNFAFRNVYILATDIDPHDQFRKKILEGAYSFEAIKRIPSDIRNKYFVRNEKGEHEVVSCLKNRISFIRHDIRTKLPWEEDKFFMIVCKNVLLHLTRKENEKVLKTFFELLKENGLLVFEQTWKPPPIILSLFEKADPNFEIYRKVNN